MPRKKKEPTPSSKIEAKSEEEKAALTERLRRYIRTEGLKFLEDPNITSIGIGRKQTKGKESDILCLQFTVGSKVEGDAIESLGSKPIPETLEVEGEEIPTDVLERRYRPSYQLLAAEEVSETKRRIDPIVPGVSVGHPLITAGTIGLIVFDRASGAPCILSNWHVLNGAEGKIGDSVVQPGVFDDNHIQHNAVGKLLRSHLGQAGDCAIAQIEDRNFARNILELDVVPARVARVELGDHVIKSGRTTGVTRGKVRRTDVVAKINYAGRGQVMIGGFEIGPEEGASTSKEISMGGDSGSAWLIANENGTPTDIIAGLHFAGEGPENPDEHALACYAQSVIKKLDISLGPVPEGEIEVSGRGFDRRFLSTEVPIPWLNVADFKDAVKIEGRHLIPYAHFSVCLSSSRRLPRFVAWNINGSKVWHLSRKGLDFRLDPRVPKEFQNGNELYRNNTLDRGHVARRADLTWGSQVEAKEANSDSFFYTNITPQHESFNQSTKGGLWGRLENAVLDEVDVEDLRVSVLGGPRFQDDDLVYRGVKIPRDYWKLIAYTDTEDGVFKVRAYVLTQRDLLTDLEVLDLDPFRIYQVPIKRLEDETGLDFKSLRDHDTFGSGVEAEGLEVERTVGAREIFANSDIIA